MQVVWACGVGIHCECMEHGATFPCSHGLSTGVIGGFGLGFYGPRTAVVGILVGTRPVLVVTVLELKHIWARSLVPRDKLE